MPSCQTKYNNNERLEVSTGLGTGKEDTYIVTLYLSNTYNDDNLKMDVIIYN